MPSPATPITFRGTPDEATDLLNAINRNCECEFGMLGVRVTACALHEALAFDQRFMNGLLFARRLAARWQAQEFSTEARP